VCLPASQLLVSVVGLLLAHNVRSLLPLLFAINLVFTSHKVGYAWSYSACKIGSLDPVWLP
jgi:hypothetical protein